jgi:enamine deaminase RidA (YjgF/YER057c/UK114 family)
MRRRLYSWLGQRFLYLGLEGEPGLALERQAEGLFERAALELDGLGLTLDNVVRTRIFGRNEEARSAGSQARSRVLTGQARAAGSSYITVPYFSSTADVGLDLFAMASPVSNPPKIVTEYEPKQNFIRHLVWEPMVFLAGQTSEAPELQAQCRDILSRIGGLLEETSCGWDDVVHVAFFLHREARLDQLFESVTSLTSLSLDNAEIEFVDGYSRPGKLVEVEITAMRKEA